MPKLTVDPGAAGPLQASLRNDVFPTEGLVHAGPVSIRGRWEELNEQHERQARTAEV